MSPRITACMNYCWPTHGRTCLLDVGGMLLAAPAYQMNADVGYVELIQHTWLRQKLVSAHVDDAISPVIVVRVFELQEFDWCEQLSAISPWKLQLIDGIVVVTRHRMRLLGLEYVTDTLPCQLGVAEATRSMLGQLTGES
jgi:hypothetical protein